MNDPPTNGARKMSFLTASVEAALGPAAGAKCKPTLASVMARAGAPRSATTAAAQELAATSSSLPQFEVALAALLQREATATAAEPVSGTSATVAHVSSSSKAVAWATGGSPSPIVGNGTAASAPDDTPLPELSEEALDPEALDLDAINASLALLNAREANLDSELASLRAEAASAIRISLPYLTVRKQQTFHARSTRCPDSCLPIPLFLCLFVYGGTLVASPRPVCSTLISIHRRKQIAIIFSNQSFIHLTASRSRLPMPDKPPPPTGCCSHPFRYGHPHYMRVAYVV